MGWHDKFIQQSEKYCNDTLATASQYLLAKQQNELCMILAVSELQIWERWNFFYDNDYEESPSFTEPYTIYIDEKEDSFWICTAILNVDAYVLRNIDEKSKGMLKEALELSMKPGELGQVPHIGKFHITAKRIEPNESWRQEILSLLEAGQSFNHGTFIRPEKSVCWEGMRFASMEERLVAQALEKVKRKRSFKLVYFPNCLARVLADNASVQIYPDFLICVNGKWAVLEVNGRQHNLPDQAERDNDRRNRLAKAGIPMFSYSAESIRFNNGEGAERVIYDFLEQLN